MRRHAIEKSGYDGVAIKRWNKSTHEVIGNREEGGIQKVQSEPQRRGLSAPAERGFTTQQPSRDRLQNRNGLCSASYGRERYGKFPAIRNSSRNEPLFMDSFGSHQLN